MGVVWTILFGLLTSVFDDIELTRFFAIDDPRPNANPSFIVSIKLVDFGKVLFITGVDFGKVCTGALLLCLGI